MVLLAAGGGWAWRASARRPAPARVATTTAARGEFVISLPTEGILQSDDSLTVRNGKASGELTLIVPEGTTIHEGDVFCRLEARELLRQQTDAELAYRQAVEEIDRSRDNAQERYENDQRAVEQAEKDYQVWEESVTTRNKQAEEQIEFDRSEAERLRLEYERSQRMADKGYLPGSQAEIAQAAYESQQFKVEQSQKDLELNRRQIASEQRQKQSLVAAAKQRMKISGSRIEQQVGFAKRRADVASRQLETVAAALAETTITAPATGTVSLFTTFRGGERRPWREGDQVSSGVPLGSIAGGERMSVRCRIKESLIASLHKGQKAEIEFEALAGRVFAGEVSTVGGVAREVWIWEDPTAEANQRVFDVQVRLDKTSARGLKPGLNARVRIVLRRLPNELYVPLDAVFERGGKSYVFKKQPDGFHRREVKTGERNEVAVVIRRGLSAGDEVAMSDPTRAPEARKPQ
jgi:HlyD family secretion protein